jgi:predicted phosphodiesterase
MRVFFKKWRFQTGAVALALVLLMVPAACSGTPADQSGVEDDQKDGEKDDPSIEDLAGESKARQYWGTLVENIPNNISNTFTDDPQTTRTITWQSTLDTGEVIIGKKHYPSSSPRKEGGYFRHRIDISGLEPGKTYQYIAGSSGAYSPVYSFTTESSGGFSVLHITDPQIGAVTIKGDAAIWKHAMESAVKKCPHAAFVVNTGDIVENAATDIIPFYFDYVQEIIANYAFVYSMGNNDSTEWYNRYFYTPGSGSNGVLYSFDYGNAHFVNVDSNVNFSNKQLTWLENDLNSTAKKWKVVLTHEANYGRDGKDTDLTKLFDRYNVNLVMAGHNHFYARSKPIDTAGTEKSGGTVWSIPNTIGAKFNSIANQPFLAMDKQPNLQMFSEFTFTETSMSLNAYTINALGSAVLFDSYTW